MTKKILKNFLLTDLYVNEEGLIVDNEITTNKQYKVNKYDDDDNDDDDDDNDSYDDDDDSYYDIYQESSESEEIDETIPKIEFIVEEDENKEKQVIMNFEFKVNESSELIKINLEISKNTYLELADELLK